MSLPRIRAMFLQGIYLAKGSMEYWFDITFFSIMNVVLFGFIGRLFGGGAAAHYVLLGVIFWEVIRINQYALSVGSLWNMWSRNLTNVFISPVTAPEYFSAYMLTAFVEGAVMFGIISLLARFAFSFNVFQLGLGVLAICILNLTMFAWTVGLVMIGLVFRYGTRIQALAWGIIFVFEPLTAAFFPVKVLPGFMQTIAWGLPPTYLFEAARAILGGGAINWSNFGIATIMNGVYLALAALIFSYYFRRSKQTGQFTRNEASG